MAGGRKKYNIWIAYTDLFTNLSTFIFISAIGVFAAIGSGSQTPHGAAGFEACAVPSAVAAELKAGNSAITPLGPGFRRTAADGCTEYYSITEHRASTSSTGIRNSRICHQVWFTANLAEFERSGGRLTFLGVAQGDRNPVYTRRCDGDRWRGRLPQFFRASRDPMAIIGECMRISPTSHPSVCPFVSQCLAAQIGDRNEECQLIWDIYQHGMDSDAICRRDEAEHRAKTLYDQCNGAMVPSAPDHRFRRPDMAAGTGGRDRRRQLWSRGVDFDSVTRSRLEQALPPRHPALSLPTGSVIIELRFVR
jgi:hypothetical protein